MTIEEAIKHCEDVANHCDNKQCSLDHIQLKQWLVELVERRNQQTRQEMIDNFCCFLRESVNRGEIVYKKKTWMNPEDFIRDARKELEEMI